MSSSLNESDDSAPADRIDADLWLRCLEEEYIRTFIPAGGAAVKIVVVPPGEQQAVAGRVRAALESNQLAVFDLTSSKVELHSLERLWFALAKSVDWDALAAQLRARIATDAGYPPAPGGGACTLQELVRAYDVDRYQVNRDFKSALTAAIFRDYGFALDFRKALISLVYEPFQNPWAEDGSTMRIKQWLIGELQYISSLKSLAIFRKIDRISARQVLLSFLHLQSKYFADSALLVDISAYYEELNINGRRKYTRRQIFELYEVIREFIDSVSEVDHQLIIFFAPRAFVEDERFSYHQYRALYARIENEVGVRNQPNPCATMVQLQ